MEPEKFDLLLLTSALIVITVAFVIMGYIILR